MCYTSIPTVIPISTTQQLSNSACIFYMSSYHPYSSRDVLKIFLANAADDDKVYNA